MLMTLPHNKKQKVQLLNDIKSGQISVMDLQQNTNDGPTVGDMILCFYHLLQGPDVCCRSIEDMKLLESVLDKYVKNNNLTEATNEELYVLRDCQQCYLLLKQNGQLQKLNDYKHFLK